MDLIILDETYRRTDLIDEYSSLIFTERSSDDCDVELVTDATASIKSRLGSGVLVTVPGSKYIAEIETIEETESDGGSRQLTIRGRGIESILDRRTLQTGTLSGTYAYSGTPASVILAAVSGPCHTSKVSPGDAIPGYVGSVSPYSKGTIPLPTGTIADELGSPGSIKAFVKSLCDEYSLGYRMIRGEDNGILYFDVFSGDDRTSGQTIFPAVVFSPQLDNLSSVTVLQSDAEYKNVCYVFSSMGNLEVVESDLPSPTGHSRRVMSLQLEATSPPPGITVNQFLKQCGHAALANARRIKSLDGEIPQFDSYVYGEDYNLNDLVEQRDSDGNRNIMRITEVIRTSDSEGVRTYPTLSFHAHYSIGSWAARPPTSLWNNSVDIWAEA